MAIGWILGAAGLLVAALGGESSSSATEVTGGTRTPGIGGGPPPPNMPPPPPPKTSTGGNRNAVPACNNDALVRAAQQGLNAFLTETGLSVRVDGNAGPETCAAYELAKQSYDFAYPVLDQCCG